MSKLVERNEDKFHNKLELITKEITLWSASKLYDYGLSWQRHDIKANFRYWSTPEGDTILLDIDYGGPDWMFLREGDIVIRINNSKNIIVKPRGEDSNVSSNEGDKIICREILYYEMSIEDFKDFCAATSAEVRVTGSNNYIDCKAEELQKIGRILHDNIFEPLYDPNIKYITCPKCGATMRERESKCPQCGTPKEEIQRLIKEQEEREAAERERIRKEREAKEAEEARIRAEQRAAWWAANKKKVGITILVLICIIAAAIGVIKVNNVVNEKQAITQAYEMIEQAEALIPAYKFDEAKQLYDTAFRITDDDDVHKKVQEKRKELEEASQAAESEYNNALRRLRILLDADDNEFNQYSNECLNKMIEIYPDRRESVYYKNLRDGISNVDATTSATQVQHATQYLRLDMKGSIGSSQGFLEYDEQEDKGNYSYYLSDATVKRKVSLESHDGDRLKLNSYDMSGKYIGQFDGTIVVKGNQISYVGTFTNYKGVSVNFKLYQK